jgi:prepilin-type N-terminal cleavage/methylation domain-containing protein
MNMLDTAQKSYKQSGFTLIELLVVIVIIGFLTGIVLMSIDPQEYIRRSRDARRVREVQLLVQAINAAVADGDIQLTNTSTCGTCNSSSLNIAVDGTGWVKFTNISGDGVGDYITGLPLDPVNSGSLVLSYMSDGFDFEINTTLESAKYTPNMVKDGGDDLASYEKGTSLKLIAP